MPTRDLLQPFLNADKNREETFMVEASGFLYNKAAHVVMAMLMNYDKYVTDFPHISIFKGMTALQIFKATQLFSSLEALNQLSNCRISLESSSEEEVEKTLSFFSKTMFELQQVNTLQYTIMPIFAYSLTQIIKERCCRKIYISNMQNFSEWEMAYLRSLFAHKLDKIELVVGKPLDLYKKYQDELTTVFLNDIYMLHQLNEEVNTGTIDREKINKQLFCLRISNDVVAENKDLQIVEYTCTDLLKEYEKNSIHTSLMPLLPINEEDTNKVVSAN